MPIDKQLRLDIMFTVRRAMQEVMEDAEEVWLTPKQMVEQFGMFSKDWLAHHGDLLPRERVSYYDEKNGEHYTQWAYPRNRIQRMIKERALLGLRARPGERGRG